MLHVLALRYPMKFTKSQLATLARLSARGGAYQRYLSLLKTEGYITQENGYIVLTEQGLQKAGRAHTRDTENPVTMWQGNLSGGARRIFDFLITGYPNAFTRHHIGDQVGLSSQGGTFGRYLSILRSNGLIEVQGSKIKAAKTLFL